MTDKPRVRFAPSPTGSLHIGGAHGVSVHHRTGKGGNIFFSIYIRGQRPPQTLLKVRLFDRRLHAGSPRCQLGQRFRKIVHF